MRSPTELDRFDAVLGFRPTPGAVRRVADRNKLPVDRITEDRVPDPCFSR